jgi:RNA polymerase sigma-70 factor (sigma-E family)
VREVERDDGTVLEEPSPAVILEEPGRQVDTSATSAVGNEQAERKDFGTLYHDEYAAMSRLAYLLVGSRPQAQEAVQDAFATVFEGWGKVDRPGAYLRTAVVNRCRTLNRRRRLEVFHRTASAPPGADTLSDESQVADKIDVLRALQSLRINRRTAIVLRYYGGLTEAETAEVMGLKLGTVKSMVSRGLTEMRRMVER